MPEPVTTPSPGNCLRLHAEVDAIVLDIHVIFFEAALIEQHAEPLARGQPALGVLRRDALLAAAKPRRLAALFELFDRRGQGRFSLELLPSTVAVPRSMDRRCSGM